MTLALDPVYFNRTAATNVDKVGKMYIDLKLALLANFVASGSLNGWRATAQGDGVGTVSTTVDANIFTGNGGLGYDTTGKTWAAAQSNSISNARAYIQYTKYVAGSPTTQMFTTQRSSSTTAGEEDDIRTAFTSTGWTGVATFNTCPDVGTATFWGGSTGLNATGAAWSIAGFLLDKPTIASATTFAWQIWTDDGEGDDGYNGAWAVMFYDASTGDRGGVMGYLPLADAAAADTTPYIQGGGSWAEMLGGDALYTLGGGFTSNTAAGMWKGQNNTASFFDARPVLFVDASNTVRPPGSATQPASDIDGNYALMPWFASLDNTTGVVSVQKGRVRGARIAMGGLAAHVMPQVATATDGSVWLIAGMVALPWRAAVVPSWPTTSTSSAWRVWQPEVMAVVPDETAPSVTLVSPLDGTVSKFEPVVIDLEDASGLVAYVVIASWTGSSFPAEVVYLSTTPLLPTNYTVTKSVVGAADRLSIVRRAGWLLPPTFKVLVVDTEGNLA